MDKYIESQVKYMVQLNKKANYKDNKESIVLLLKEFARRLLLWGKAISDNGIELKLSTNIIFDVVQVVLKRDFNLINPLSKEVGQNSDRYVSFFDEYAMSAHFNWELHEEELRQLGYSLPNPYKPYVELFKLGGYGLKFESPTLEVYPFIRIMVHPRSEYMSELPFWDVDLTTDNLGRE